MIVSTGSPEPCGGSSAVQADVPGHRFIALEEEPSPAEPVPAGSSKGVVAVPLADGDGSSARAIHSNTASPTPFSRATDNDGERDIGDPAQPSSRARLSSWTDDEGLSWAEHVAAETERWSR